MSDSVPWDEELRVQAAGGGGGGGGEGGGGDGGAGHDKKQGKAKEASAQSLRKGKTRVVYICVSLQHH